MKKGFIVSTLLGVVLFLIIAAVMLWFLRGFAENLLASASSWFYGLIDNFLGLFSFRSFLV